MSKQNQSIQFSFDSEGIAMDILSFIEPRLSSIKNEILISIDEYLKLKSGKKEVAPFESEFLTRGDTMKFLSISDNCLREWTNKGILKNYRVGNRTYYRKDEVIETLLKSNS